MVLMYHKLELEYHKLEYYGHKLEREYLGHKVLE